jgi:hypothetical protein
MKTQIRIADHAMGIYGVAIRITDVHGANT